MRTCVIFNPTAKGNKARHFLHHLNAVASQCAMKPTWAAGAARILAADAVRDGFSTIIAAGGDGTLNEVVNGFGDVPDGFERARLAVLPLGTANVFAKEMGIPMKLTAAWDIIRGGRERRVDLGTAEFEADGEARIRYFAQMTGAGLDARAVELVSWNLKKKAGWLAYIWAAWLAWRENPAEITVRGEHDELTGSLAVVGNGHFYGGNFVLLPRAVCDDGVQDVCVFEKVTARTLVECAWGMARGTMERAAGARHFQAKRVTLHAKTRTPFHVDGELAGHLPVTLTLQPKRLRVVVP
ncbi:MAG TPA: diacylglycerol kinase family protein [Verrucomicrobiae bacterium]|nr:diacylglycerol kinase family protein [Verrucomicrobiae bacterium]